MYSNLWIYSGTDFSLHVSHETSYGKSEEDSTSISVSLGDPDIGDEFVVDLYYDKTYGTFIFDTVAGISKCIHEKGTARSEDPQLRIISSASSFIFPDEEMVFEIEMLNAGSGPDSFFYIAQEAGSRNLPVIVDSGAGIDENGHVIQLYRDKPVIKQISIGRGYLKYEFPKVDLTLKSMCEADMNVNKGAYTTKSLSNTYNDNDEPVLKWLQPCPEVEWAGALKTDRTFLFNSLSQVEDVSDRLIIDVFNPLASKGKNFTMLMEERNLEHIWVEFGMVGTPPPPAKAKESDGFTNLDFAPSSEDTYGYASLYWYLEDSKVPEGTYEIQLHSKCTFISGSPSYVKEYLGDIITGVYDVTLPEQYGLPIPLRYDILIGEEISVYFTEEMWCRKPYTFDIKVDIIGTPYILKEEKLHINCDGRKLGIQLDLMGGIDVSKIIGKEFTVEIGTLGGGKIDSMLMDRNKNPMDPDKGNVSFKKRFANFDLSSASTAFVFTMDNATCTNESVASKTNEVRQEIASIIGIENIDRVRLSGLICQYNSTVTANAEILPNSARRMFRSDNINNIESKDSTHLFYLLRDTLAGKAELMGRKLRSNLVANKSYQIRSMKVKPSSKNVEQFKSNESDKEEEMKLATWALGSFEDKEIHETKERTYNWEKLLKEKDAIMNKVLEEKDNLIKDMQKENDKTRKNNNAIMKKVLEENDKARTLHDAIMKKVLDEKDYEFLEMKSMMEQFLKKQSNKGEQYAKF